MGQLFDKSIRKGFSDIFDSAYGTSALENRLRGALASSLYDARLSSSGYNQARTRTVEDALSNRQALGKRLEESGDVNALSRFQAGEGHSQDWMKGRVGAEERKDVVSELQRLENLGTSEGTAYRRGHIFGDSSSEIASGLVHGIKGEQIISNKARVDQVLADIRIKGLDVKSKEGQANLLELILKGDVKGTDVKNLLTTESKIALTEAKATTEVSKQTLKAAMTGRYRAEEYLFDEKVFTEEAKQGRLFALEMLADAKVDQLTSQIKTNKKHIDAKIEVLRQKKRSGEIVDDEVLAKIDLLIEKGYTEILTQEKMLKATTKLNKEADRLDAMIEKVRAETRGEKVDIGLAVMEAMGLDTKSASGDSIRNSYTKMYVTILKEDPILMEEDPDNLGQMREQVWKVSGDNPKGQKKLFSNLNAEDQKTYIESRIITDRKASYDAFLASGKVLDPKAQTIVDAMMQSIETVGQSFVGELNQLPPGSEERKDAFQTAPSGIQNALLKAFTEKAPTQLNPPTFGEISNADMVAAMSGGGGDLGLGATPATPLMPSSAAPAGDPTTDELTNLPKVAPMPGGDLDTRQKDAKAAALQKIVADNNWSPNIATLFSELIATQAISQVGAERLAAMSVVELQALMKKQVDNKQFSTDILPIVQAMIKEKS